MELTFRFAQESDTPLILWFIRALAEYEHLADQVVADEATLKDQPFYEVLYRHRQCGRDPQGSQGR